MNISGWVQLAVFVGVLLALTKPMGLYLVRVLDAQATTFLDPVAKPLERLIYRACGVDPAHEQDWRRYALSLAVFSLVGMALTYTVLRTQHLLPLNPRQFGSLNPDLSFNTSVSFNSNTNWQSYAGETTMSYFSQMVALALANFTSAAVGISVAAVLVRGVAR